MSAFELNNKRILITGASSGIGRQVAITCSEQGAEVILTGRDASRLNETTALLNGSKHSSFSFDIAHESEIKKFVSQIEGIDGLVHCAGVLEPYPIKFLTEQKINETFSVNFNAVVILVSQLAAQKKINQEASFVFLSSISAQHPHKGNALYCASKAALESFSITVALEFQHLKMRSNCICPAMIKTPMYDKAEEGMSKERMDEHISKYPLGVGYPEDVANAALFLLSQRSRWITGTRMTLDGGFILEK